jgi:hypothetical protein
VRYAREVLALTAVVFGCGGRPSGAVACCAAPDVASASHADGGAGAPADAKPGGAFPDALRFRREEGCARTLARSGDRDQDLAALGKLCAAGLVPVEVDTTGLLRVPAGRIVDVPFSLVAGNACLRVGAIASSTGGLSVALYRGDRLLGSAVSPDSVVVTPPDGPVCVREAGAYRAVVLAGTMPDASADPVGISLRIWQATGD